MAWLTTSDQKVYSFQPSIEKYEALLRSSMPLPCFLGLRILRALSK